MKSMLLKRLLAALLLALALGSGSPAVRADDCCLILPSAPSNSVTAFLIDYYPDQFTADSLLTLTLSNSTILPAGAYATWCVDATTEIDPRANGAVGTVYTGNLYSTCDTNELALIPTHQGIPPVGPPPVTSAFVWHEINYILNHRAGYFYWDVQTAINTLVGGPPLGPSPPYPPMNPVSVQAILDAALTNSAAWHAQCGDKVGDVFVADSVIPLQLLIVEVPCCSVKFTTTPPDVTLGCNPAPATIPDCQNPVNTNLVNATSCCGRPVTITCSDSQATVACKTSRFLTYTATDGFGNTATFVQTITWTTDTNAPVITSVPTSGDLGCNPTTLPTDASVKAQVTVTDSCSSSTITVSHVDGGTPCAMSRTFTITASDTCGNVSAATTVVYTWKIDTTAPAITCPPSVTIATNLTAKPTNAPPPSQTGTATATDNCDTHPVITYSDSTAASGACSNVYVFTRTWKATDACGNSSTCAQLITIGNCPPLSLACAGGSGQVGVAYSSALVAGNGASPYIFSILSGSLPAGLTLNTNTGVISGIPTTNGTFSFTAKVTDSLGATAVSICTSGCSATPVAWNFNLPSGKLGNSQTYTVNGLTITAYGFLNNGQATALYGKNNGGDESGVGIAGASDNEITTANFVQLDLTQVIASGAQNATILLNSVQTGEGFNIYGSHTKGSVGTILVSNGHVDHTALAIPSYPTYEFISVRASAANVLLGAISVTTVAGPCAIIIAPAPCTSSISGFVIRDCDASGNLSGDSGLPGVTVSLKKGSSTVATTTTSATGSYTFTNLVSGSYTVVVTPPANYQVTYPAGCNHQIAVNLSSCQNVTGISFGYTGTTRSCVVTLSCPTSAKCGDTVNYSCTVTNTGTTCFSKVQVTSPNCGGWQLTCPTPVKPGESCTFNQSYTFRNWDAGTFTCNATATGYPSNGNSASCQSSCTTRVSRY